MIKETLISLSDEFDSVKKNKTDQNSNEKNLLRLAEELAHLLKKIQAQRPKFLADIIGIRHSLEYQKRRKEIFSEMFCLINNEVEVLKLLLNIHEEISQPIN